MAAPFRIPTDCIVEGNLTVVGNQSPRPRSSLIQDTLQIYVIPWYAWRVHDAIQTNLPGTPASDDLGLIGGTLGSATPSIQTSDLKNAGATTMYARTMVWLPPEYDTAETVKIRLHAGMLTTVASVSATIDAQAYRSNNEAGVGLDLVQDAAKDINNLTLADKDFTLDAATLARGDWLDVRIAIAVNDSATVTAVKGILGMAALLLDIKG